MYLANKYLIKDLDKFCRNFIINNKAKKTLPKDVFKVHRRYKPLKGDIFSAIIFKKQKEIFQEFLDMFTKPIFYTHYILPSQIGFNRKKVK